MSKRRGTRKVHRGRRTKKGIAAWSTGKKIAVIAVSFLLVLVIGGGALAAAYVTSKMDKLEVKELDAEALEINQEVEHKTGYLNVALFGVDSREASLGKGTRSDTIIIASLNHETGEVRMSSVYRDTLLEQADGSYNKANAAYSFGGVEDAVALLNRNLDLDIEHYVAVNFNAMIDMVDRLGGLDVNLTEEEVKWTNAYCNETAYVTGRPFEEDMVGAGVHHLDGVQATAFCRIRKTKGDDYRRTERQREVIQLIAEKLQSADLATLNDIIDSVFPQVGTNFTMTEILSYAKDFKKYKLGETTGFPFDKTTDTLSGIGSTVIPVDLAKNVQQLHQFLFGDDGYTPSQTVMAIGEGVRNKAGDVKKASDEELANYQSNDAEEPAKQESGSSETPAKTEKKKSRSGNGGGESSNNSGGGGNSNNNGGGQAPKAEEPEPKAEEPPAAGGDDGGAGESDAEAGE